MELDSNISLPKKYHTMFNTCKYFFAPVLNSLNVLHTDKKFLKPKLSKHLDEATVTYFRGKASVYVQYFEPNYIDVTIGISNQPIKNNYFIKKAFDKEYNAEELSICISDFLNSNIEEFYEYMRANSII